MDRQTSQRKFLVYLALGCFCLLTAARDSLSEVVMKADVESLSPIGLVFFFFLSALIFGFVLLALKGSFRDLLKKLTINRTNTRNAIGSCIWITLASITFLEAIESALGASLTSFIDYSMNPLITAVFAFFMVKERLDRKFWLTAGLSIIGIFLMSFDKLSEVEIRGDISYGLLMIILSCSTLALSRIANKQLLNNGFTMIELTATRFSLGTVVMGILLLSSDQQISLTFAGKILGLSFVGFALPLFIVLYAFKHLDLKTFSLAQFLIPTFTLLFSWGLGMISPTSFDLAGAFLIITVYYLSQFRDSLPPVLKSLRESLRFRERTSYFAFEEQDSKIN